MIIKNAFIDTLSRYFFSGFWLDLLTSEVYEAMNYTDLLYKKTWQEAHWRCMRSPVCCPHPPSVWTCRGGRTPWPSGDVWWAACTDPRSHNPHLFSLNLLRKNNRLIYQVKVIKLNYHVWYVVFFFKSRLMFKTETTMHMYQNSWTLNKEAPNLR